jgi:hypothetical protein
MSVLSIVGVMVGVLWLASIGLGMWALTRPEDGER